MTLFKWKLLNYLIFFVSVHLALFGNFIDILIYLYIYRRERMFIKL